MKIKEIIESIKKPDKICGLVVFPVLKVSNLDVEEFGEFDYVGDNKLDGINSKGFYRVSTESIEDAIKEIRTNKDSSFITCYNDAFKEGVYPKKISVLLKHTLSRQQPDALETAILNFFEVPTTLNLKVINDTGMEFPVDGGETQPYEDVPLDRIVMSVDALKEDEKFYSFIELGIRDILYSFDPLYENTTSKLVEILSKPPFSELSTKEKDDIIFKIRDQLAISFLTRQFVCCDADFGSRNVGLIINEKKKTIELINFDYEFAFKYVMNFSKSTIKGVIEVAPKAYEKFIVKCKQLLKEIREEKIQWNNENCEAFEKLGCTPEVLMRLYRNLDEIVNMDLEYRKGLETLQ